MATTLSPATPGASAAPANAGDDPIAAAGEAFLATLTPEQRNQPLADPDEDAEGAGAQQPAPAEAATEVGEPITRDDGAEWNETAQRWTREGQFVAGAPPEGWTAPAKPETPTATQSPATREPGATAAPAESGVKVTLPGIAERGEEDIEVEVDADLADRIQRLKNEGLRAKDYASRRAEVDRQAAALEAYQQELEIDPIGFHINRMPKDQQIAVARALIVEHMDELAPDIEQLRDPAVRLHATKELRDGLRTSQDRLAQQRQVAAAVREVVRAVESIVPDGTDEATFNDFVADARRDLARVAESGERVTPQNVKQLLARRVGLYGFDKPKAPATPSQPLVPVARPMTPRAQAIADRRPVTADAASTQARIRRTQAARAAGARVAPVGAGAAPVQTVAVPPEAEADIESMSRHLRKSGLPSTWASIGRE